MIKEEFFPTTVYGFDVPNAPQLNVQLEKDILEWSKQDKGVQKTNVKGWHSKTDMQTIASTVLSEIEDILVTSRIKSQSPEILVCIYSLAL